MARQPSPGRRRRASVDRALPAMPASGDVEAAVAIAQQLVALPLEYPSAVSDVAALIAGDPRNREHVQEIVAVILTDAMADPFWETTANRWRPALPAWVRPAVIGATVRRLTSAGVLVTTGRHVRSTDTKGGNTNKLQPIYALNLNPLRERAHAEAEGAGEVTAS